jgi:hypothetical protein
LIFFQFTGKDLKCLFSLLLYFSWNEGTDDNLYLNIYVLTSFKEMLWPIQFIKGARPGFKRPTQVTSDSAEKRFKYKKEKRSERIFNAKWCEGRPWLKYDRDENVMTCTICTKCGKRGESGNLKNKHLFITGCNNFRSSAVSDHAQYM